MNIKVKYLNWDLANRNTEEENELCNAFFTGKVLDINDKNYRDINEYKYINDGVNITRRLEEIYREHNRIDDDSYCRLKSGQRSMCTGDLIFVDDVGYVVKNVGFEKIYI